VLLTLILSVLVPVLAAEVYIYSGRFERRVNEEHHANLELARVFAKGFELAVQDILRQESAIGVFLGGFVSPSSKEAQRVLEANARDHVSVLDFHWVGPEGRITASSNQELLGLDLADRPFIRTLVSGADWVVSNLIQSKRTGEPLFVVGRAIRDSDQTLLGLVLARIAPERLDPVLAFERPRQGTISLLDSRGAVVYSYPRTPLTWEERHLRGAAFEEEYAAPAPLQDGDRIVAGAPISSIGWLAVATRSRVEVTRPITLDLAWNGSILLVVIFSSLFFSVSLSRFISRPIRRLQIYALRIARGEVPVTPPDLSGPTEVQDLTRVFVEAEEALRENQEDLKRQLLDHRQAVEALRESEERHRSIFENSMDGIILSFPYGRILAANPEACRMHGYTEAEMCTLGRNGITDAGDPRLQILLDERCRTGRYRGEVTHIRRDGSRFPCETSTVLFKDKNGRESSVVIIRDITERKEAEEAMQRVQDELELRVRERTAELERRNRELQDFIYIASHDLREPLRKIQVFGDLVVTNDGASMDRKSIDHLCRMQDSAARMETLLESLLAYSRVSSKADPFSLVDLSEAVRRALSNLEIRIKESQASVEVGRLPVLEGDSTQFAQLFQNLLMNSLKFRKADVAPLVKVYCNFEETHRPERVEICLKDNGIGFDERYLDKIFVPFQRLHGRHEYEGVGMGLAICRKIVERHGGTITARSRPGKGATFIVTLPARQRPSCNLRTHSAEV
jgi:two-component system sensor kinase FixL